MHINFYDIDQTPLTQVYDFLELEFESQLNASGKCTFALSYNDPHLSAELFELGKHMRLEHFAAGEAYTLFEGIITAIIQKNDRIVFEAVDYVGYLAHRLIEDNFNYSSDTALDLIITALFEHIDTIHTLPFILNTNDITDNIKINITKGTTALSAFQKIAKIIGEFRVCNQKFDFSNQTGKTHSTLSSYDYLDGKAGNILEWEWERNASELANRILEKDSSGTFFLNIDTDSIIQIGVFAKYLYVTSGATQTPKTDTTPMPEITLDTTRLPWWDYQVGDRQNIQITTPFDYLNLEYTGIIQKISLELKNSSPVVKIGIAENVKDNANPLEKIEQRLQNLEI